MTPCLGSGTTAKVALQLSRHAIGYEIQPAFEPIIRHKLRATGTALIEPEVTIIPREQPLPPVSPPPNYRPSVQEVQPLHDPKQVEQRLKAIHDQTHKIVAILDATTLRTENGLTLRLAGITVPAEREQEAQAYLRRYVLGKRVLVRLVEPQTEEGASAYLYLTNRLFINRKMVEMGIADADAPCLHKHLKAPLSRSASVRR